VAVLKPRTKVVFFRVSEEEFQQMEAACNTVGARSISDFARTAARQLMNAPEENRVQRLTQSFDLIHQSLERLYERVQEVCRLSVPSRDGGPSLEPASVDHAISVAATRDSALEGALESKEQ
jgi:hypothetical protein